MVSEFARKLVASAIIWPDKIVDKLRARPDVIGSILDPTLHSLAVACCSDQAERHEGAASIAWLIAHARKAGCTIQADYIAELSDAVDLCPTVPELESLFAALLEAPTSDGGGDLDSGFDQRDPRWGRHLSRMTMLRTTQHKEHLMTHVALQRGAVTKVAKHGATSSSW